MTRARRFLRTAVLGAAVAVGVAGPAFALDFRNTPDAQVTGQLNAALLAYREQNGQWPVNIEDLRRYARDVGRPLDLGRFAKIALTQRSQDTVYVEYTTKQPKAGKGSFAVTVIDVR